MNWLTNMIGSSIGKKLLMSFSGFAFCGFLMGHLAGNLSIYGGPNAFNSYAEHLHALGPLITIAEIGLLLFALVHILTGLTLFYQNLTARPVRYEVNKSAGGRTLGSATMPYSGLIILAFLIFHLLNFHFVDKSETAIYQIVASTFQNPLNIGIYIFAMIIAAIHVSHGFWSAFQTFGLNHIKYMPTIKLVGILFSLAIGIGFGFLPVFITLAS